MDDQYGLPSDLRHLSAQPSPSSIFPATLTHRNMTPSSSSSQPGNAGYQLPLTISSMNTTSFPLVSGGGLVVDNSHFPHNHHHYQHGHHQHHSNHNHDQFESGAWNNIDGGSNININNNNSTMINSGDPASNNNCRWPRQETLTLLEIRSRLNSKFKDTNQKAPLWDEISRIMAEEHGYQRSGKKCKEKFENLYKYYKKTKEGKAGRQDGKHYRFFRQLEAIYGDQCGNNIQPTSSLFEAQYLGSRNSSLLYDHHEANNSLINRTTTYHESLSFSINSTEFETSSSDNNNNNEEDLSAIAFKSSNSNRKMKGAAAMAKSSTSWKAKVEGFVDSEMRKIMATQETWMEKMLKSVIDKEEERVAREDERRRLEASRLDREASEFWAKEKAWVEARDVALMGAFKGLRGNNSYNKAINSLIELPSFPQRMSIGRDHDSSSNYQRWSQEEISTLISLRTSMETSMFEGNVYNNNNNNMNRDCVWEDIASKMVCLGFGRSASECKQKWESVSLYVTMTSECKKKRREDYHKTSGYYFEGQELELKQENDQVIRNNNNNNYSNNNNNVMGLQLMDERLNSPSSSNVGSTSQMHPNNFFQLLFGEGENLWEKYGTLKLGKR